jgi:hypothetical protein
MKLDEFRRTLAGAEPPAGVSAPLAALWWAAKDDRNKAHAIVMDESGRAAAWVHAYLHRVEGDLGNAQYWYARAGRPAAESALECEWQDIASALLDAPAS